MPTQIATLESDALPADFRVARVLGAEAMNELPHWTVVGISDDADLDLDTVIGTQCRLCLRDAAEGAVRPIDLSVRNIAYVGASRAGHVYELTLSHPFWPLTLRSGFRMFTERTTAEIALEILRAFGLADDALQLRLASTYERKLQCVQHAESDWSFVERLLAEEGIAYWFDLVDERPVLILCDHARGHEPILSPETVPFRDVSGMVAERHFDTLDVAYELLPDAVHVRDYDVRRPDLLLDGRSGAGPLEHFEYPARVATKDAAERRALARLEQLRRHETLAVGGSDCIRLQPGRTVHIEGLAHTAMNGAWLVVAVEHRVGGTDGDGGAHAYRNNARLVPAGRTFRPAVPSRMPRVSEVTTAVTTGPRGEEIHVDDLGRVKLRFLWDRSGVVDDRSSAWTRTLQLAMGGAMALPRVGWEVPVLFFDGDPDRPLVLGRVYNATAVVPYALPGAAPTTAFQSATSPSDGTTNELRLNDAAGEQELFVHASRDLSIHVGGSAATKVGANETHDVGLSLAMSVAGSQAHAVGGAQSVSVGGDHAVSIHGGRSETIGGSENVEIAANRFVSSGGAYTELVGAGYSLRCNQANTVVSGTFIQGIAGGLASIAGIGMGESVAAARTEVVGAMRTVVASKFHESVTGMKAVSAGATQVSAGSRLVTSVRAAGTLGIGGSAALTAGGDVVIDAPDIVIDVAGDLDAKALALTGGSLKAKSGTTKLKGPITRKGGATIE